MHTTSFGDWLKRYRKTADLTQRALAQEVGCTVEAIRKIEASKLRPSRRLAERLATSLHVPEINRATFLQLARSHPDTTCINLYEYSSSNYTSDLHRYTLPTSPTPLIGREEIIAEICSSLGRDDLRLLTLTGAPGIGKTRLALQSAHEVAPHFRHGAIFVSLTSINDPNLVVATIAQTLDIGDTGHQPLMETITAFLRDKHLLLVLDNFEHILDAASKLTTILEQTPLIKLLVTSRISLRISGEHVYVIDPLTLPDPMISGPAEFQGYSAVDLFVRRAQANKPDFTLTQDNAADVAAICTRLDGIPLAIELAAARSKILTPRALLRRLDQCLALLTEGTIDMPDRHQTLCRAIAWSYDLLDPQDQALFRALGIFMNGCTLTAVIAIVQIDAYQKANNGTTLSAMPTEIQWLDQMTKLIQHNLIQQVVDIDEEPRFVMLETVRAYALDRLNATGEIEPLQRQHAHYYLQLAEAIELQLKGANQASWLHKLDIEYSNLRTALEWSLTPNGDRAVGIRIASALWLFWNIRGHLNEGRSWFTRVLEASDSVAPQIRVVALARASWLARQQGDYPQVAILANEGLTLARVLGDRTSEGLSLCMLGLEAYRRGDRTTSIAFLEESSILFQVLEDPHHMAEVAHCLGTITTFQGDLTRAHPYFEQELAINTESGHEYGLLWANHALGMVASNQGNYDRAIAYYNASLQYARTLQYTHGVAIVLNGLGVISWAKKDYHNAARYYTESLLLFQKLGHKTGESMARLNKGYALLHLGQMQQSVACFTDTLAAQDKNGEHQGITYQCLNGLARISCIYGEYILATRLFATVTHLLEKGSHKMTVLDQQDFDNSLALAKEQLHPEDFDAAWQSGYALSTEQAIAEALNVASLVQPPTHDHTEQVLSVAALTKRESDVLRLVARGFTNRAVAEQLVISPRTVNAHLNAIYTKIGISSRYAAIRFAIERGIT
ncbi:MAG: tetratricopeptide repeat protein [Chloroflexota bacterium]